MEPDFAEEITDQIRSTNFKVTKIPVWALKKFKQLCKEEYGNIYFVGIIQLMKIKEKYEEMTSLFNSLQKHIDNLQKQIDDSKSKRKEIKTFGD